MEGCFKTPPTVLARDSGLPELEPGASQWGRALLHPGRALLSVLTALTLRSCPGAANRAGGWEGMKASPCRHLGRFVPGMRTSHGPGIIPYTLIQQSRNAKKHSSGSYRTR
jgi:hypothetical protein